jgi:hypothetical protein
MSEITAYFLYLVFMVITARIVGWKTKTWSRIGRIAIYAIMGTMTVSGWAFILLQYFN